MRTNLLVLTSAVLLIVAGNGLAQGVAAIMGIGGGTTFVTIDGSNQTAGFSFTANANLIVSALGFYAPAPLNASHPVGLWTATGTLLSPLTAAVPTSGTPNGSWRYVSIPPVVLLAGQTYFVGSDVTSPFLDGYSRVPVSGGTVTTSPSTITVLNSAISPSGSGFAFPSITEGLYLGRFGPNLLVTPTAAPTIGKSFGLASIPVNGSTSLSVTVANSNSVALTGVGFTDPLPTGLVVATPNALTNNCGGTATATAGSGSVSLSGGTLAASTPCTVSVNVTGTIAGTKVNTTGNVTSTEGGTGSTASATLTVGTPTVPISPWTLAMIAAGLAVLAFLQLRRRKAAPGAVR